MEVMGEDTGLVDFHTAADLGTVVTGGTGTVTLGSGLMATAMDFHTGATGAFTAKKCLFAFLI